MRMQVNRLLCKLLAELTVVYDKLKIKVGILIFILVRGSIKGGSEAG